MGAGVTALVSLKTCNAPLVINTPHLPREPYVEDDEECPVMEAHWAAAIEAVLIEAERYLDGKRAQGSLFKADGQPTEEADNGGEAGELPASVILKVPSGGQDLTMGEADLQAVANRIERTAWRMARESTSKGKPFRTQAQIEGQAKAEARRSRRQAETPAAV
jgi:phage terminase small subunit